MSKQTVKQDLEELFKQAADAYEENPMRAHRYAQMAWSMALKHRVHLSAEHKKQFCKQCHHFLQPGKNARFRTRNAKIITTCLDCGAIRRTPLKV